MFRNISADSYPYHYNHDLYQEYYWDSLDAFCRFKGISFTMVPNVRFPSLFANLRRTRYSYKLGRILKGAAFPVILDAFARIASQGESDTPVPEVGCYVFSSDEYGDVPVCIDSRDTHEISCEHVRACAAYFKTNYWSGMDYPFHVLSLPNMNPLVGRDIDSFHRLRSACFKWDLFAFIRVWGGTNDVDGIDHNLKLLEELSKVRCKSLILAYLVCGDIASQKKRLDALGIRWTTSPMAARELWRTASESRLNLIRMGMHQCTPWRLIDILAMGRVPVFDYHPLPVWPVPLVDERNFLSLDFGPEGDSPRRDIADSIGGWLDDPNLLSRICNNNAEYFDQVLAPKELGRFIVNRVESVHPQPVNSARSRVSGRSQQVDDSLSTGQSRSFNTNTDNERRLAGPRAQRKTQLGELTA